MSNLTRTIKNAAFSGAAAGALSAGTMALMGKIDRNNALAPLNGPSQWLWGERGARETRGKVRTTLPGILIHQLTSVFWAAIHERTFGRNARKHPIPMQLLSGAVSAATAYVVDYALTPKRFQPGFEKHLSRRGMFATYAAFGVGLTVFGIALRLQKRRG